jgi:predicted phosphodiesterase
MKYAILGDIHANLEALAAVLADAVRHGAEQYISTGDIVGYNANPVECMKRLQTIGAVIVQGNHDHYAGTTERLDFFNSVARRAIRWTRDQLNANYRQQLAALPMILNPADFTVVHSSLDAPEEWTYILTPEDAAPSLFLQQTPLCFYGHTHRPIVFRMRERRIECLPHETLKLEPEWKYLINAGSVGQPRDGDPRAAYVLYDEKKYTVSLHRVEYDIPLAQAKIRAAGLPEADALRLAIGR